MKSQQLSSNLSYQRFISFPSNCGSESVLQCVFSTCSSSAIYKYISPAIYPSRSRRWKPQSFSCSIQTKTKKSNLSQAYIVLRSQNPQSHIIVDTKGTQNKYAAYDIKTLVHSSRGECTSFCITIGTNHHCSLPSCGWCIYPIRHERDSADESPSYRKTCPNYASKAN